MAAASSPIGVRAALDLLLSFVFFVIIPSFDGDGISLRVVIFFTLV